MLDVNETKNENKLYKFTCVVSEVHYKSPILTLVYV